MICIDLYTAAAAIHIKQINILSGPRHPLAVLLRLSITIISGQNQAGVSRLAVPERFSRAKDPVKLVAAY